LVRPISSHSLGLASATKGELVLVLADGLYRHLICDLVWDGFTFHFPTKGSVGAEKALTVQQLIRINDKIRFGMAVFF
jgi:hypothetical protein